MRIISGTLKNKTIAENKADATHPMSEKLRGAIFNALGDIEGLSVLDGCAGTGMVGFEALSRGAARVHAVEKDDRAFAELTKNARTLLGSKHDSFRAFHCGIRYYFKRQRDTKYDVIIYDPPYSIVQTDHFDGTATHLADDGIMVFSLPDRLEPPRLPGLEVVGQKSHGIAQLIYYRHAKK